MDLGGAAMAGIRETTKEGETRSITGASVSGGLPNQCLLGYI